MNNLIVERKTLQAMIRIYCRGHHQTDQLCADCSQLMEYAEERLAKCPFGNEKPACQNCPVHCYKPEMRQRIREVMRYAGPRMIWRHPLMAIQHVIHSQQSKKPDKTRNMRAGS